MKQAASETHSPIDYWREIVRRGVMALDFSIWRFDDETWLGARIASPQAGLVRRAAHAAMEIDKEIALETGGDEPARQALAHALEAGAAPRQKAAYHARLSDRLWRAIEPAPGPRLQALAAPHED